MLPGEAVITEEGYMASNRSADLIDSMKRVTPFEEHEAPRLEWNNDYRCAVVIIQARPNHFVILVILAADQGRTYKLSAAKRSLKSKGDYKVGLIEMPSQLVSVMHRSNVESAHRVRVAVERI